MFSFSKYRLLVALAICLPAHGQSQNGDGTCTNADVIGTYYYPMSGDVLSGTTFSPYAELGKLVADGRGNISGRSQTSVAGSLTSYTLAGTYSVQANCTGTLALTADSKASPPASFEVVNSGEGAVIAYSQQSAVIVGRPIGVTEQASVETVL